MGGRGDLMRIRVPNTIGWPLEDNRAEFRKSLQFSSKSHGVVTSYDPKPYLFVGGVHKIQILIRELLEDFLRNFFGEEMGGVRGTQAP